jgi:ethanolamine kinase
VPGVRVPILFKRLDDWLDVTLRMDWGDRAERIAELNLPRLAEEITSLKAALSRIRAPVVFAHNDLLGANILQDMEGRVVFIDFEYGEYNYRAFDIANHFCEYAGFDCDYTRYPDKVYY